jgi:SAM-dependent methyltransferase
MIRESVKEFYDRVYTLHREQKVTCPNAIHDLDKATRRVVRVASGFGLRDLNGANVLDVGCGLGYYTKALSLTGAKVTGLDFSDAAIEAARTTFPECQFSRGSWPDDIAPRAEFDLIWMVNFSLMNTFDVNVIRDQLVREAMLRLKPGGTLVVGWNSDFSGRVVDGYSHWPIGLLGTMSDQCGLSAPLVAEARTLFASWFLIRAARVVRRSIPIFMVNRKTEHSD